MNPKQARAAFRHHEEKMAELRANTIVDPNSTLDVINEGTLHMVEHFTPPAGREYSKDYVFVMGKAFLGLSKDNGTTEVQACSFFHCGDTHEWSHDLADLMNESPELYDYVMHAVHICHLKKFSGK